MPITKRHTRYSRAPRRLRRAARTNPLTSCGPVTAGERRGYPSQRGPAAVPPEAEPGRTVAALGDTRMTTPDITGIAPFFIVRDVPAAMAFYRDRLGFDIVLQGPSDDDIFFGIVRRGAAMILLKAVGVEPVPNYTRDIKQGIARWDAYLQVPDPDALAAEFSSRNVVFLQPLKDDDDGLRGFEVRDADGYVLFFGRPR